MTSQKHTTISKRTDLPIPNFSKVEKICPQEKKYGVLSNELGVIPEYRKQHNHSQLGDTKKGKKGKNKAKNEKLDISQDPGDSVASMYFKIKNRTIEKKRTLS